MFMIVIFKLYNQEDPDLLAARDRRGSTAAHYAATHGRVEVPGLAAARRPPPACVLKDAELEKPVCPRDSNSRREFESVLGGVPGLVRDGTETGSDSDLVRSES